MLPMDSALPAREPLADPWNGVSLGGWLLLEPGPSYPLFDNHAEKGGEQARSEWDLLKLLHRKFGKKGAAEVIQEHRERHISKRDFERIRDCGLNAVRLPFGYWVVLGADKGEPYVGPGLQYIDRALDWAEECGLQVVLDLHGCPGGESGEAPCGRRQRPSGTWKWGQWRQKQSLEALKVLVQRYKSRRCVTGITVCNEPSNEIPELHLVKYYSRAVDLVRKEGMPADKVAVVLPVFQRNEDAFIRRWEDVTGGRHRNICFDVHCYHCFENEFNGKTLAQQLRAVEDNARMLQRYPMVVGEWSLSLGVATWVTCGASTEPEVYNIFGRLQREAFKEASHGRFFWNWTERPDDMEWNFQTAYQTGLLHGPDPQLPDWDGKGEDPLEEQLHPSPAVAQVRFGEPVYLRVFYGRYIEVQGGEVGATWADKGSWQELSFCPAAAAAKDKAAVEVRHGDVVRLRSKSGKFLAVDQEGKVTTVPTRASSSVSAEFTVRVRDGEHGQTLRHRGHIYLRSRSSDLVVDADEEEEGLSTRFSDCGWWQQIAVEKHIEEVIPATPERSALLTKPVPTGAAFAPAAAGASTPPRPRRRTAQVSSVKLSKELHAVSGKAKPLKRIPVNSTSSPRRRIPVTLKKQESPKRGAKRGAEGGGAPPAKQAKVARTGSRQAA